jgi:hypothetical protein
MKVIKAFALGVLVLTVGSCGYYLIREGRARSAYESAQVGQNESVILEKLGPPDQALECGEYLWWNGDQANPPRNEGQCKKWVRYNFFLHAFAFGYSSEGALVSRYVYHSE